MKMLSDILSQYYDKEVIILIDEYDVPLDKVYQYGYYEEMFSFMRSLLYASGYLTKGQFFEWQKKMLFKNTKQRN